MYVGHVMYVTKGNDFASVSTIFLVDFGNVLTICYFCFSLP
jgi:hypothetical protein